DEEEIDDGDPRLELVEKLIAYRKFKDVAHRLSDLEEQRMGWFTRNVKPDVSGVEDEEDGDDLVDVGLYDLIQAFKSIMRFLAEDVPHTIEAEGASVDQKIEYIMDLIIERGSIAWAELFEGARSRVEIVCCFLAILELCRMGDVSAHQHKTFGDIRLFRKVQVNVA
ncbi:MAG: segregation/condensation protein A, partial [Bdellovibrionota bacterium]